MFTKHVLTRKGTELQSLNSMLSRMCDGAYVSGAENSVTWSNGLCAYVSAAENFYFLGLNSQPQGC